MNTVWVLLILWVHIDGTSFKQRLLVDSREDCHAQILLLEDTLEKANWNVAVKGKPEVLCYEVIEV